MFCNFKFFPIYSAEDKKGRGVIIIKVFGIPLKN